MLARQVPQLPVLAYDEVTIGAGVESLATISLRPQNEVAVGGTDTPETALPAEALAAPALTG